MQTQELRIQEVINMIGKELLERIEMIGLNPKLITQVEFLEDSLITLLSNSDWLDTEIQSVSVNKQKTVPTPSRNGNLSSSPENTITFDALPNCTDVVVSNLGLIEQYPPHFLAEANRILRNDGLFIFSSFGANTYNQLRSSCQSIDRINFHNFYFDMHDLGDMLLAAQFSDPVVDIDRIDLWYSDLQSLIDDVLDAAITEHIMENPATLNEQKQLSKLKHNYPRSPREGEKYRFHLGIEIIYGIAWKIDKNHQSTRVQFDAV